jgi:hypothetical protein
MLVEFCARFPLILYPSRGEGVSKCTFGLFQDSVASYCAVENQCYKNYFGMQIVTFDFQSDEFVTSRKLCKKIHFARFEACFCLFLAKGH